MDTKRVTADLPNIANIFAPAPPELSPGSLVFQCDAKHSCDNDHLVGNFYGLYATDQIDMTDKWKVRLGVRQDWFDTELDPLITVPTSATNPAPSRFTSTGVPIVAGVPQFRNDAPVSWSAGTLYKLFPGISPYIGASKSYLTNFNSENTQNGIGAPESALQYEAGVKFSLLNDKVVLNTAGFTVMRDNVATLISATDTIVFDSQRTNGAEISLDAALTRAMAPPRQRDGAGRGHHPAPLNPLRPSATVPRVCRPTWPTSGAPTGFRLEGSRDFRSEPA